MAEPVTDHRKFYGVRLGAADAARIEGLRDKTGETAQDLLERLLRSALAGDRPPRSARSASGGDQAAMFE